MFYLQACCFQALPGSDARTHYEEGSSLNKTKHKAVLWPIVMDLRPFSYVNDPGSQMQFRLLDPCYEVRSGLFYRNVLDKVGFNV